MKKRTFLAAALLLTAAFVLPTDADAKKARTPLFHEGSRPPDFTLYADIAVDDEGGEQPQKVALRSFLGHKRIVLVFSPTMHFLNQIHGAEYNERDFVAFAILVPDAHFNTVSAPPLYLLTDDRGTVSREYHALPGQPTFYLIGKDGTIKMARHSFPTNKELLQTIDAMPMRQQEMWERNR